MNKKQILKQVVSLTAKTMADENAPQIQESLAASALVQSSSNKQTG